MGKMQTTKYIHPKKHDLNKKKSQMTQQKPVPINFLLLMPYAFQKVLT